MGLSIDVGRVVELPLSWWSQSTLLRLIGLCSRLFLTGLNWLSAVLSRLVVGLRLCLCVSDDTAPFSSHPSVRWLRSLRCLRSGSRGDEESPVSFICTRLFITRVLPPLEVRCACFAFWGCVVF